MNMLWALTLTGGLVTFRVAPMEVMTVCGRTGQAGPISAPRQKVKFAATLPACVDQAFLRSFPSFGGVSMRYAARLGAWKPNVVASWITVGCCTATAVGCGA